MVNKRLSLLPLSNLVGFVTHCGFSEAHLASQIVTGLLLDSRTNFFVFHDFTSLIEFLALILWYLLRKLARISTDCRSHHFCKCIVVNAGLFWHLNEGFGVSESTDLNLITGSKRTKMFLFLAITKTGSAGAVA